jgi:hypothetical protein
MRPIAIRVLVVLLALQPAFAEASSFTNAKINRLRTDSSGRAFFNIVPSGGGAATTSCTQNANQAEDFIFDADTVPGRLLYAQVLSAYTTQSLVDISGGGASSCVSFFGFPTNFIYETLSGITVHL